MHKLPNLSHAVWDCKYHLAWIPKFRKKILYGELRRRVGSIHRELAMLKEGRVLKGKAIPLPRLRSKRPLYYYG